MKYKFNSTYTVKSGYWVAKKIKDAESSKPSSSSNNPNNWRWFWALNIPPKMKIFLWRCMNDILPTKKNLASRQIQIDPCCSRCESEVESIEHILRDCPWSSFFWKASVLRLVVSPSTAPMSFQDWILLMVKDKQPEFVELFAAHCWMIWKARNLLEFQNRRLQHQECFALTSSLLEDFQKANRVVPLAQTVHTQQLCWSPPPSGWVKVNSDASLGSSGVIGIGGIFRDEFCCPLREFACAVRMELDIECAEALACLCGVQLARASGFKRIIFEVDNKALCIKLQRRVVPRTQVGTFISDILILSSWFEAISFQWVRRNFNNEAHLLANRGRTSHLACAVSVPFFCDVHSTFATDNAATSLLQ